MSRMGLEISRLRKELGMTHKQLAKSLGVTEGFIIEVEAGRRVLNENLIKRVGKVLRQEVGKLEIYESKPEPDKNIEKVVETPVQDIWNDALAGVIMNIPVYNYKMDHTTTIKKLPIIANKVEGLPKDRVIYLTIEDNDMTMFRLSKGDMVLAYKTHEINKEGIFLIQFKEKRMVRQLKDINNGKLLLVSNRGSLVTETVYKKDVDIVARLVRVEIEL
ncbi:UNVERIFIED_CONTAM: putative transcriptional regulator with C-terminal CBS domains [Acetivibrio alkalicellulosi]